MILCVDLCTDVNDFFCVKRIASKNQYETAGIRNSFHNYLKKSIYYEKIKT
jgi:hypothetical protein